MPACPTCSSFTCAVKQFLVLGSILSLHPAFAKESPRQWRQSLASLDRCFRGCHWGTAGRAKEPKIIITAPLFRQAEFR